VVFTVAFTGTFQFLPSDLALTHQALGDVAEHFFGTRRSWPGSWPGILQQKQIARYLDALNTGALAGIVRKLTQ